MLNGKRQSRLNIADKETLSNEEKAVNWQGLNCQWKQRPPR